MPVASSLAIIVTRGAQGPDTTGPSSERRVDRAVAGSCGSPLMACRTTRWGHDGPKPIVRHKTADQMLRSLDESY